MGKVFVDDKLKIQTLCEQGLGYCGAKYPEKNWKLDTVELICNTCSNKLFSRGFELLASCDSLKCQISMFG